MANNFGVTPGFKYLLYQQLSGCMNLTLLNLPQFLVHKVGK